MSEEFKYALGVAGTLLVIIWQMIRQESSKHQSEIEKRATVEALNQAKLDHASSLKEVRDHFTQIIERNHEDYQQRIKEVHARQDRDSAWLREEMNKHGMTLRDMRSEQLAANSQISQHIQQLSLIVQRGRRNDSSNQ